MDFPLDRYVVLEERMLDEIKRKIDEELEKLNQELNVELPERISKAVEQGDLRENADYKSALDRQEFVQARIGHLQKRMAELSKIDVKALPADKVGFGSRVRVKDQHLDEELDLTIVAGDFMDLDAGHVSMASPIGRGLLGAREGEEVSVQLPVGERSFKILKLETLPQQVGLQK